MKSNKKNGFTLLELIVVIAIAAYLFSLAYSSIFESREDTRVMDTGLTQKELTRATEAYFRDMGFYPPDVNRGWDPGFERSLPWNDDVGGSVPSAGTNCSHCPTNWQTIVAAKWAGPYMLWPKTTQWGGKYDYNYWATDQNRPGSCPDVSKGIYAGAQGYYGDTSGTIPLTAEKKIILKGYDSDACENGEAQLLLWRL